MIQWVFSVEAIPAENAIYTWRGPDGDEVPLNNKRFGKVIDGDTVTLQIKPVEIQDMGTYPFTVGVLGPYLPQFPAKINKPNRRSQL